jgi:hypothetical protein
LECGEQSPPCFRSTFGKIEGGDCSPHSKALRADFMMNEKTTRQDESSGAN